MALYLGNNKIKINFNGTICCLHISEKAPTITGIKLLTSDNYVLKDLNGLYLTAKEGENNGE